MSEKCIILYSGGQDSRLLLELAEQIGYEPYCILIDYGQKHIKELEVAKSILDALCIKFDLIKLSELEVKSKLTSDRIDILYPGVSPFHVPGRNLMFVSIAASIAESEKISRIWIGANAEDYINLFPDCYQEWIGKVNNVIKCQSTFPITVEAPLLGASKLLINKLCKLWGIKDIEYFSGYGKIK